MINAFISCVYTGTANRESFHNGVENYGHLRVHWNCSMQSRCAVVRPGIGVARSTLFSEFAYGSSKFLLQVQQSYVQEDFYYSWHESFGLHCAPADTFIVLRRGNNISALETNCASQTKDMFAIKTFKDPWHGAFTFHKQSIQSSRVTRVVGRVLRSPSTRHHSNERHTRCLATSR